MNMDKKKDNFSALLRETCDRMDVADSTLERRIMLDTMNRMVANAKYRSKISFIISLCATAAIFVCVLFLVLHFLPVRVFVSRALNFDSLLDKLPVLSVSTPLAEWLHSCGVLPLSLVTVTVAAMVALCWSMSRTFYK